VKMQNIFPKMSETQGEIRWTGPALGEHNDDVYRGLLGMSDAEVEALKAVGAI